MPVASWGGRVARFLVGCLLAALVASPAAADWLVTKQGDRVETEGAWEVRGALVVFTRPDGTLSSLRLSDVDMEASKAATAQAERKKEEAGRRPSGEPAERKRAAIVVTNEDVHRVGRGQARTPAADAAADPSPEGDESTATEADGADGRERLDIASWRSDDSEPHLLISGTVRNRSDDLVGDMRLEVTLLDHQGQPRTAGRAALAKSVLMPGETTTFEARFAGADRYHFERPEFDLEHVALQLGERSEPRLPSAEEEQSGRRLTNADVGPGQGPLPPIADTDSSGGGGEDTAEDAVGRGEVRRELAVLGLERTFAPDGHAVVRGTVRNTAAAPAAGISLTIHLHDGDGGLSGTAEAELGARALQPGAETTFVAEFPDVFAYETLRLVPRASFPATAAPEGETEDSSPDAPDAAGGSGAS